MAKLIFSERVIKEITDVSSIVGHEIIVYKKVGVKLIPFQYLSENEPFTSIKKTFLERFLKNESEIYIGYAVDLNPHLQSEHSVAYQHDDLHSFSLTYLIEYRVINAAHLVSKVIQEGQDPLEQLRRVVVREIQKRILDRLPLDYISDHEKFKKRAQDIVDGGPQTRGGADDDLRKITKIYSIINEKVFGLGLHVNRISLSRRLEETELIIAYRSALTENESADQFTNRWNSMRHLMWANHFSYSTYTRIDFDRDVIKKAIDKISAGTTLAAEREHASNELKRILDKVTSYVEVMHTVPRVSDEVLLGVGAPKSVKRGAEFTARFIAYIESLERELEKRLKESSPRSHFYTKLEKHTWRFGESIKVKCYGQYLTVQPSEHVFKWNGKEHIFNFDVKASPNAKNIPTVLKFDVLIDEIVIGRLRTDLKITTRRAPLKINHVHTRPFRTAFASYASGDRLRVLDRVAEIKKNGVDVFMDCLSLNPGEEWKPRLEREIIDRNTFLLFWSANARDSEYVDWEWRTALKHKGIDGIHPHPLDPVSDAKPIPEELKSLHFEDPHNLLRKAYK